ncbi:unnamed protein product [Effrenium voratum]|nr:unnamed protein product [Effrenium voratum]
MSNDTWPLLRDVWPRFPSTGWDHWLRHGSGLRTRRECVAPEVPRTKHVDSKGTNVKAGSSIAKLLERMATSTLPHGELGDVSYLLRPQFVPFCGSICQGAMWVHFIEPQPWILVHPHAQRRASACQEFPAIATKLQIYPGQPRGSHRGVILLRHPQSHVPVALVDRRQGEGLLPDSELWLPHPDVAIMTGKPNQACQQVCQQAGMACNARQLEFVNRCEVLKKHFPCENGCGHQVGPELPSYVQDRKRDTAMQCLVTDESPPNCAAHHPATTRLCACLPSQKRPRAAFKCRRVHLVQLFSALIVLSSKLGTPQQHMFRLKTTRVTLSWRSFRGRDTLDQHPLLTRTCQFVFGRDHNQLAAYRDAADMPKKGNRANRSTVLSKMLAVRGDGEVLPRAASRRCRRRSAGTFVLVPVLAALASSSASFCGSSRSGIDVRQLQDTAGHRQNQRRQIEIKSSALPMQEGGVAGVDGEISASPTPVVLLLHPDAGSPGFAEVPHLGTLLGAEPSWAEAAEQLVRRVRWDLAGAADLRAMSTNELCQGAGSNLPSFDFVLGVDLVSDPPKECSEMVQQVLRNASSRLFISSSKDRSVGSFWTSMTSLSGAGEQQLSDPGPLGVQAALGGYQEAVKLRSDVMDLWHRRTAEEAVYAMLVLIDGAVTTLSYMAAQRPVPTSETIFRAIDKCQDQFRNCFTQPRCLQSLACLSQCGLADQSCSYRCIVSYQSDAFTEFSLCALQKQNLLNSQIERPQTPRAKPMETFRGAELTHEVAESILVGHFDPGSDHRHSWLVAAGSNPAYEQFALQYQLWYKGSGKNTFWYHPTFLVEALDGAKLWRTRDYRVRRRDTPGMWDFSVVDNGIISEEKWHLLGADDDLQWLVLFYVGVARKAGLAYRGCLILTPEGQMPSPEHSEAIAAAIARADMKPWELEATSNPPVDPANPPPLIAPETQEPAPLLRAMA